MRCRVQAVARWIPQDKELQMQRVGGGIHVPYFLGSRNYIRSFCRPTCTGGPSDNGRPLPRAVRRTT